MLGFLPFFHLAVFSQGGDLDSISSLTLALVYSPKEGEARGRLRGR